MQFLRKFDFQIAGSAACKIYCMIGDLGVLSALGEQDIEACNCEIEVSVKRICFSVVLTGL